MKVKESVKTKSKIKFASDDNNEVKTIERVQIGAKRLIQVAIVLFAIYGVYCFAANVYGYYNNLGKVNEQVEECTNDPTLEKCQAYIETLKKANKNATGIVDGAGKLRPKPE